MNKVITVSLNGNAYQIDEEGYNALHGYIRRAEAQLQRSADQREVMSDLEQAIADKCSGCLRPHKNVVTAAEIVQILTEIGPVQTADGQTVTIEAAEPSPPPPQPEPRRQSEPHQRRLYRILEGSTWAGVCTGLAAFADIQTGNVRGIFVIATILTGGFGLIVYIVMAFVVPVAYTEEELIAAHSRPPRQRHA
jgi:phage shock protein PspC (stress-responsive transcriptional regulator)